jgi:hypothetical protein
MTTEQMEEVERMVRDKYPKSDDEKRGCQTEIFFRNMMRKEYREKLIKQYETIQTD